MVKSTRQINNTGYEWYIGKKKKKGTEFLINNNTGYEWYISEKKKKGTEFLSSNF